MIDLQNQLAITNKVKNSLEAEVIALKKTIFSTKDQYSEELKATVD